jgi:hypothetical protein
MSPRQARILYAANSASGASQIMLADSPDGRDAQVLTSGSDPLWLRGGDEFIYNIDASHAAIFSLSMRTFRLLSDPGLGGQRLVLLEKAVSGSADSVALLFGTNEADRVLAIYEGRTLDHRASFSVPQGYQVQFDRHKEDLLVSRQVSAKESTLCLLDWRAGILRSLGQYPSLDLVNVRFSDHDAVLLGRRRSKDVWLSEGSTRRRLTTDGENYSAALSSAGDLLVSKRADDGTLAIWKQSTAGTLSRMTQGPLDVGPDFSPDGLWWVYTDYAKKSVMLCSVVASSCRVLRRDELLPAAARFSRDGRRIAYITQTSVGRLVVTSVLDGSHKELGDAHFVCPPIWSSAELVWTVDGTEGHFFRTEWNAATGQRTGRRVPLASNPSLPDDVQCAPIGAGPDSPFFERLELKADESSTLLRLAWEH